MALSTLDPHTALIVVDLQKGLIDAPFVHPIASVVKHGRQLVAAFRRHHLPIAFVNVAGTAPGRTERPARQTQPLPAGWTDFIDALSPEADDLVVTKHSWGAFATTDLDAQLRRRQVTQVLIAGVATGTGVESTARQAYELGYNVTLAIDAMTDGRAAAHDYSLHHVFPRLGETATTRAILDHLDTRST
ncbi:isochorismatase family protein [Solimonas marina]|uniref:Isochorismatase family protein n=1 Tax=Solimonas marina TaxID=2714601 RepID=A0A969WBC1_9GAMM|nr:isochorismatase family protein [Solimonas marina]NKF23384.1 isochorismatase family protein [Solimonas marina]